MPHKRFYVRMELQLHALTCPGVWLCSHGYLEATIKTLGYYFRTGAMEPRFPMLCHDRFTMEGYFKSVDSLEQMQKLLAAEQLEITLWQNGRRLAYFVGQLANVLRPMVPPLSCPHSANVQLLMKATSAFPGILAPKVELSAQLSTQDRRQPMSGAYCQATKLPLERPANPNRSLQSGGCLSRLDKRRQQQAVCHAKHQSSPVGCRCMTPSAGSTSASEQLRRLSTCSSLLSSQTLSSNATYCSNLPGSIATTMTTTASTLCDLGAQEHQLGCDICQAYRRVFASYYSKNNSK